MRVAYISTDPGVAYGATKGAAVHVRELVRALAAEGADVLLIVAAVAEGAPPAPRGVTLELLPGPGKRAGATERLGAEPARRAWLERRLAAFRADAVYERLALHSSAASLAAGALGIPHLVELNAPLPAEAVRYRRLEEPGAAEAHERLVLGRAARVLAVSRPLAVYARARGSQRAQVLPNAVAMDRFSIPARPRQVERVVFAGSLRPWHGVEAIAEAWRMLGSRAPSLLVIGEGPGAALLEAAGAERTGALPHEEVPAALARAGIGVAPYAPDAPDYFSPLKLFEYLATGLAVIAADLPGVSDVVDARTALLIPPGDAPALAEAVGALSADPDRRARMGHAGRELVAERHTWAHRARSVLAAAREERLSASAPEPLMAGALA